MFTISEAADRTGMSAYTLRYYEKIGLLPSPDRLNGGRRRYSDGDLEFISFLKSLKDTGMSLDDIQEFVKDGCIWERIRTDDSFQLSPSLTKRIDILAKHVKRMESKRQELEDIISMAKEKLSIYHDLLMNEEKKKGWEG